MKTRPGKQIKTKSKLTQKSKLKSAIKEKRKPSSRHKRKSQEQLVKELLNMRRRISDLEKSETEHTAVEEALKETEVSLMAMLASMADLVFVLDKQSRFVFFHAPNKEDLYMPPHKFIGKKHADVMPEKMNKLFRKALMKNKKGENFSYEYSLNIKDKEKWFYSNTSPIFIDGKFNGSVAVVRDITERRYAEDILKKTLAEQGLIFDSVKDLIMLIDKDFKIIRANLATTRFLGLASEKIVGRKCFQLFHGKNKAVRMCPLNKAKKTKKHEETELYIAEKDLWVSSAVDPILNAKGVLTGAVHIIKDITKYKKVEDSILREKQLSESLINSSVDGILAYDHNCCYTIWNPAMERISGMKRKDVIGRCAFKVFPFLKKIGEDKYFYDALAGKTVVASERPYTIPSTGRKGFFEGHYAPLYGENKQIMGGFAIIPDVTERIIMEKKIRESERNYHTTIDAMADAVHVVDKQMRLVIFNNAFKKWNKELGFKTDVLGKTMFEAFPFLTQKVRREYRSVFNSGKIFIAQEDNKIGNKRFITETRKIPIFGEGKVERVLTVIRDISEEKKVERELHQSLHYTQELMEEIIQAMAVAVEKRDPNTAGHQHRTAYLAAAIADKMGYSEGKLTAVYWAALIHDVGKIHVPTEILNKPSSLTESEFAMIKTHPREGGDILRPIKFPWDIAEMVSQHHERMDGSGYPAGISGNKIMPEAKILMVADVVAAMTSDRPYRKKLTINTALKEILENKGKLYDPKVVDVCVKLLRSKKFRLY